VVVGAECAGQKKNPSPEVAASSSDFLRCGAAVGSVSSSGAIDDFFELPSLADIVRRETCP
jgi:hypothetical protein